ncbi:MAG: hypothetical protein M5U01_10650 [Ardenticatenaceae bacterium]|nr:hypothetical protein [Ardenticatenaceae bacterium]
MPCLAAVGQEYGARPPAVRHLRLARGRRAGRLTPTPRRLIAIGQRPKLGARGPEGEKRARVGAGVGEGLAGEGAAVVSRLVEVQEALLVFRVHEALWR